MMGAMVASAPLPKPASATMATHRLPPGWAARWAAVAASMLTESNE